jgi:hypothetical protein
MASAKSADAMLGRHHPRAAQAANYFFVASTRPIIYTDWVS